MKEINKNLCLTIKYYQCKQIAQYKIKSDQFELDSYWVTQAPADASKNEFWVFLRTFYEIVYC